MPDGERTTTHDDAPAADGRRRREHDVGECRRARCGGGSRALDRHRRLFAATDAAGVTSTETSGESGVLPCTPPATPTRAVARTAAAVRAPVPALRKRVARWRRLTGRVARVRGVGAADGSLVFSRLSRSIEATTPESRREARARAGPVG